VTRQLIYVISGVNQTNLKVITLSVGFLLKQMAWLKDLQGDAYRCTGVNTIFCNEYARVLFFAGHNLILSE
jgi:hypothetical protein